MISGLRSSTKSEWSNIYTGFCFRHPVSDFLSTKCVRSCVFGLRLCLPVWFVCVCVHVGVCEFLRIDRARVGNVIVIGSEYACSAAFFFFLKPGTAGHPGNVWRQDGSGSIWQSKLITLEKENKHIASIDLCVRACARVHVCACLCVRVGLYACVCVWKKRVW